MASELPKDIRKVYVSQISSSTTAPTTLTVTNVSTNNLLVVNASISNLNLSSSTINNINVTNITSTSFIGTNSTITNSVYTALSSGTINFTTAIGSNLTIPNLLVTTRISSASIQGTNSTITNSVNTSLSSGTINFTNSLGTNTTISNIVTTNILSTNLSNSTANITNATIGTFNVTGNSNLQNIVATNQTLTNLNSSSITSGTLLATTSISSASIQGTNLIATNITSSILRFTNAIGTTVVATNTSTGQLLVTNTSTATLNTPGATIGALNVTGTSSFQNVTSTNETTGVLIATTGITTGTILATTSISTGQFTSNNISSGTINVATGITTSSLLATGSISTGQLGAANISTTNLYVTTLITGSNLGVNNVSTGTLRSSTTRGILIGSSNDIDSNRMISALNNTLSSGGQTYITLGVAASGNNQAEFSFVYFTSGSTLNRTNLGISGSPNLLSILGSGNLGINNTNPSYRLDVTGDIRGSGNIYLGGNIYPNTNITTASNLTLNVYGGTLSVNGPTTFAGYGINAAGTSTLGNIVSIGSGNVGIGVASPNSLLQIGASTDVIYGNNPLASNTINMFGPARASPIISGTSDMNGTLFINSTSTYGRNVGASIALGGRGNNFGGGNAHMTFARIQGVQANDRDTYDGNLVLEVQSAGSMFERLRIRENGFIGINMTSPAYLLDVNGTIDAVAYTGGSLSVSGSIQAGNNIAATGNITNGGFDFILGNTDQSSRGNSGSSRALVKNIGNVLQVNFAGDFTGGTEVQGNFFRTLGNSNTIGSIITTGGNVGIGTGTPASRLHVHNSGTGQDVRIILSDATTTVSASRGFQMIKNGGQNAYIWNYEGGFLQLGTNNSAIITLTGGNVGIGTASPSQRLDISGNIRIDGDWFWLPTKNMFLDATANNQEFSIDLRNQNTYTGCYWQVWSDKTSSTILAARGDTMNVGVGTISPSYKLHVNGDTLTNGWFRTTGDTGLWSETYSRGIRASILGDYGNVETHGEGKNNWEGYSIHGRYAFMSSDNNQCGIYNDVDNQWIMYFDRGDTNNKYAQLRHNDNTRLQTTSSGIYVSSRVTVDAGSGTAGYYFGENPGGGSGDAAWIKYYARSGEGCNLELGISNDGDDHIYLNPAGGVGIGTNGPAAKLDVANGGQTMAIIRGNGNGTNAYQSDWPSGWDGGLATRDITVTSIYYSNFTQRSDIRKKTNIETYTRGLNEVLQLRPVTFNWKPEFYYNPEETQFGFIAQEVEPIIPEIVGEDSQGYKYIKTAHIPLLVNSIKELNNKLEEEKQSHIQTKQELEILKSQVNQLFQHLGITQN